MPARDDLASDPRFAAIPGKERTPDEVRVHRLAEGAWILQLPLPYPITPSLNAYLLETSDGLMLVDCGTAIPPGWESLVEAFAEAGASLDDLALLVTTHPHTDHAALAATVVERTGCRYARLEAPLSQLEVMRDRWLPASERMRIVRELGVPEEVREVWIEAHIAGDGYARPPADDILLRPGDVLPTATGVWEVMSAAGHSSSMLALWNAGRRWLVSADLVLPTEFQYFEWGHLPDPYATHLASLRRVLALDIDLLLPGHGRPLHHGIGDRIRFALEAAIAERGQILGLVSDAPQTPYAISVGFVPDDADLDYRQASLSLVTALLDHLEAEGLVVSSVEDGVRTVRRVG
jgi:glyoxylase-like metal-dependent hydrolase (beta-lactamase superfamily II)